MKSIVLAAAVLALALAGCKAQDSTKAESPASKQMQVAPILATADAKDAYSYARPLEARVANVELDLALDFDSKRVGGTATLDVIAAPGAKEVVLDSKGLDASRAAPSSVLNFI